MVNGVTMESDKVVMTETLARSDGTTSVQALVTPERVNDYLVSYLTNRPQLKQGSKAKSPDGTKTKENTRVGKQTVINHRKALTDLYKSQRADFPDSMEGIQPPNTSPNWSTILGNFEREEYSKRQEDYGSRGTTLLKFGYDDEQHVQLSQYGLKAGFPGPQGRFKDGIAVRVHWQHLAGHTMFLRSDDRLSMQLPDLGAWRAGVACVGGVRAGRTGVVWRHTCTHAHRCHQSERTGPFRSSCAGGCHAAREGQQKEQDGARCSTTPQV